MGHWEDPIGGTNHFPYVSESSKGILRVSPGLAQNKSPMQDQGLAIDTKVLGRMSQTIPAELASRRGVDLPGQQRKRIPLPNKS